MLKHTISISCCLEVTDVAFVVVVVFLITKLRKKLEVDLTHVNKTEKTLFSHFMAIYD